MSAEPFKILVVDDEKKITEVVRSYLENSGYQVHEAFSGREALQLLEEIAPSLVILDLMLPDISGEEICRTIREKSTVPIIMLTAKIGEEDILTGLGIGADDYVIKPFSPRQLMARVAAVLRRSMAPGETVPQKFLFDNGELNIDTEKHEVKKNGELVGLTPNEYRILITMAGYPSKVFTRDELITFALGEDFNGYDRTVDTHIKNLRQKIETDPKNPGYILTIYGIGYKFGGE